MALLFFKRIFLTVPKKNNLHKISLDFYMWTAAPLDNLFPYLVIVFSSTRLHVQFHFGWGSIFLHHFSWCSSCKDDDDDDIEAVFVVTTTRTKIGEVAFQGILHSSQAKIEVWRVVRQVYLFTFHTDKQKGYIFAFIPFSILHLFLINLIKWLWWW